MVRDESGFKKPDGVKGDFLGHGPHGCSNGNAASKGSGERVVGKRFQATGRGEWSAERDRASGSGWSQRVGVMNGGDVDDPRGRVNSNVRGFRGSICLGLPGWLESKS